VVKLFHNPVGFYAYLIVYTFIFAFFITPFIWAGWNYGLVHACPMFHPISWYAAYWLCVLLHTVKLTPEFSSTHTTGVDHDATK